MNFVIPKPKPRVLFEEARSRVTIYKGKYYYNPSDAYKRMREKLKPIVVYCLLAISLVSCSSTATYEGSTITNIHSNGGWIENTTSDGGTFFTKRNVYNIGDTVKFCK